MDLQAEIERMMLEKKATEASQAQHEAEDVSNYMMKDAKEHALDAMNADSEGNPVNRFKRTTKALVK